MPEPSETKLLLALYAHTIFAVEEAQKSLVATLRSLDLQAGWLKSQIPEEAPRSHREMIQAATIGPLISLDDAENAIDAEYLAEIGEMAKAHGWEPAGPLKEWLAENLRNRVDVEGLQSKIAELQAQLAAQADVIREITDQNDRLEKANG